MESGTINFWWRSVGRRSAFASWLRAARLLVAFAPAWLAVGAGALAGNPQDDCQIGSIERARYQEIRAQVAKLPPMPWDAITAAATSGPNPVLTDYLRHAIEPVTGVDARFATLHAILRTAGASYSWAVGYPLVKEPSGSFKSTYMYGIDSWKMGLWRPICRESVAVISLVYYPADNLSIQEADIVVTDCVKRHAHHHPPSNSCPVAPYEVARLRLVQ